MNSTLLLTDALSRSLTLTGEVGTDRSSVLSGILLGLIALVPGVVLVALLAGWRKPGEWLASMLSRFLGPTFSVDWGVFKLSDVPVRAFVFLPPCVAYLIVVSLLMPVAVPRLATLIGAAPPLAPPEPPLRSEKVVGHLIFSGGTPGPNDSLTVIPRGRRIEWRTEASLNQVMMPFVLDHFPIDDSDATGAFVKFEYGCMASGYVALSPTFYKLLRQEPQVSDSAGVRLLKNPIILTWQCSAISPKAVPGAQTPAEAQAPGPSSPSLGH